MRVADGSRTPPGGRTTPGGTVATVVGLLVFFELTSGILQGAIVPLLPHLQQELDTSTGAAQWITAVQFLSAAVCVPALGRLGDLYGHRRMLRGALVCVTAGSVLCALAPNLPVLLAGRVLLGPLAALLPLEIGLVRDRLSTADSRRAVSLLVGALTLGNLLGSALAGPLQSALGEVRHTLWVLAAVAGACTVLANFRIPESRSRAAGRMDWRGAVLLALALVALLGTVSRAPSWGWLSPATGAGLAAGVLLLAGWVRAELARGDALVDVRALARRALAPHYLSSGFLGATMLGGQAVAVSFLDAAPEETGGYGFGLAAWQVSVGIAVPSLLAFLAASAGAAIGARLGYRRLLTLAFTLVAVGFAGLIATSGSLPLWGVSYALAGTGFGLALAGLPTVIVENSPPDRSASVTAIYNNVKTLGASVAGAAFSAVLGALVTTGTGIPSRSAYFVVWAVCASAGLAAAVLTALSPRHD